MPLDTQGEMFRRQLDINSNDSDHEDYRRFVLPVSCLPPPPPHVVPLEGRS